MRGSKFSGIWPWLLWLLLCVFLSINNFRVLICTNQDNVQSHLKEGQIYGKVDSQEELAIKILNISETNIERDNRRFYVVETDGRLVLLESDENSEDLKYILESKNKLESGEYYLAVGLVPEKEIKRSGYSRKKTIYNITPQFLTAVKGDIKYNSEVKLMEGKDKELVTWEYVSLHRYEKNVAAKVWLSIIFVLLSIITARHVYKKIQSNIKEYNELKEMYPEMIEDFSVIKESAEYKDEKLKILIYKGVLITYYRGFSITKFSDLKCVDILEVETRRRGLVISAYSIGVVYHDGKVERWLVKKYKKETYNRLGVFGQYIMENHGNIEVRIRKK